MARPRSKSPFRQRLPALPAPRGAAAGIGFVLDEGATPQPYDQGHGDSGTPAPCHADTTQVVKRLKPGQPGTLNLHRHYGAALVCVRYREDLTTGQTRLTTVELVVDQRPTRRQPLVRVNIRYDDLETRRQAMLLGAQWDEVQKSWRMPRRAAIQLGLLSNRRKVAK